MRSIWTLVAIVALLVLSAPRARAAKGDAGAPGARRSEPTLASAPAAAPVLSVAPPRAIRLIRLVKPKKPKRAISLVPSSSRWLKLSDEVATARAFQQRLRRARQRASRSRLAQAGPGADPVPPPTVRRPGHGDHPEVQRFSLPRRVKPKKRWRITALSTYEAVRFDHECVAARRTFTRRKARRRRRARRHRTGAESAGPTEPPSAATSSREVSA